MEFSTKVRKMFPGDKMAKTAITREKLHMTHILGSQLQFLFQSEQLIMCSSKKLYSYMEFYIKKYGDPKFDVSQMEVDDEITEILIQFSVETTTFATRGNIQSSITTASS